MRDMDEAIGDEIMPEEVIGLASDDEFDDSDADELARKVSEHKKRLKDLRNAQTRMARCRSANDVFSSFASDAAKMKVKEAIMAKNSSDRQRAQETILDRALGKAVDRSISLNVEIANLTEEELNERIRKFSQGSEGGTSSLLLDEGRVDQPE